MAEVAGIPAKIVLDPRIDPQKPRFIIEKGAEWARYYQEPSTNVSTANVSWSILPPNKDIAIDRKMYIDVGYRFTLTGPDVGADLLPSIPDPNEPAKTILDPQGVLALRFLPWQSVVDSLAFTLNQSTITQNLSEYVQSLVKYGTGKREYQDSDWSIFPSMEDQFQQYAQGNGTNRNALGDWGDVSSQQSRGSFYFEVESMSNTEAVVVARWSEPVVLSPMLFSKMEEFGFLGLTNIQVRANMGTLSRMLSIDATNAPAGLTVSSVAPTSTGDFRVRLCYLTPPKLDALYLDPLHKYPYYEVNNYNTNVATLASGASASVSSQNFQLSSIPKRVCLMVRRKNIDRTPDKADGYFRINSISVNWNNKNALLSSATSRDLYELSVRNGNNQDWYQWYNGQGGVLMLDFAHDIGLSLDEAVGLHGQYQLQIDMNITNICGETITDPLLQVVVVSEGMFTIDNTETYLTVGDVFPRDVIEAMKNKDFTSLPYYSYHDFQGGSFWGALKKLGKKAVGAVKKGVDFYHEHQDQIDKAIKTAGKYAPLALGAIGLGYEGEGSAHAAPAHAASSEGGARMGGAMMGGAPVRRKSLRRRA